MGQLEKSVFACTWSARLASGTFKGINRVFEGSVACLCILGEEGQDLDHIY